MSQTSLTKFGPICYEKLKYFWMQKLFFYDVQSEVRKQISLSIVTV